MQQHFKNLCLILLLCGVPSEVYGYFDPGTGSLIIQAIIAFIAGSILFFKRLWLEFYLKLMNFISKFRKKNSDNEKNKKTDQ